MEGGQSSNSPNHILCSSPVPKVIILFIPYPRREILIFTLFTPVSLPLFSLNSFLLLIERNRIGMSQDRGRLRKDHKGTWKCTARLVCWSPFSPFLQTAFSPRAITGDNLSYSMHSCNPLGKLNFRYKVQIWSHKTDLHLHCHCLSSLANSKALTQTFPSVL